MVISNKVSFNCWTVKKGVSLKIKWFVRLCYAPILDHRISEDRKRDLGPYRSLQGIYARKGGNLG